MLANQVEDLIARHGGQTCKHNFLRTVIHVAILRPLIARETLRLGGRARAALRLRERLKGSDDLLGLGAAHERLDGNEQVLDRWDQRKEGKKRTHARPFT